MKVRRLVTSIAALVVAFSAATAQAETTVWRNGDTEVPKIAITVDDCYKKEHVTDILDICDEYGVKITFFPVGSTIDEKDREIWQRIVLSGHEIGNHTFSHKRMTNNISYADVRSQFVRMEKALDRALGFHYEVLLYRPPYGNAGKAAHWRRYEQCGYTQIIKWSVSQTNFEKCIKQVENGSILLFHANAKDANCLRELIPAVLEAGFTPVTVSELIGLEPYVKEREDDELVFPAGTTPEVVLTPTPSPAESPLPTTAPVDEPATAMPDDSAAADPMQTFEPTPIPTP